MFNQLCIIGVGLIGGSIAKAVRQKKLATTLVGWGRSEDIENLKQAKNLKIIDHYYTDIQRAVYQADCVIIATPVSSFEMIFKHLKPYWSERTVYTDAGSTKGSVMKAAITVFGHVPSNFIPAHPIAGTEKSGAEAALTGLFENKRLIITPLTTTHQPALAIIQKFWEDIGAVVSLMEVKHHDVVFAATSHLPHILAYALTDLLCHKNETVDILPYAASGLNDFTRIASSDPTMWQDICLENKDEIIPLIVALRLKLKEIESFLHADDREALFTLFNRAKKSRQKYLDRQK